MKCQKSYWICENRSSSSASSGAADPKAAVVDESLVEAGVVDAALDAAGLLDVGAEIVVDALVDMPGQNAASIILLTRSLNSSSSSSSEALVTTTAGVTSEVVGG